MRRDRLDFGNFIVLVLAFSAAAAAAQQAERLATSTLDAIAHADDAGRTQHLDTVASLKRAQDGVNQATRAADAATAQVQIAKDTEKRQLRAYVSAQEPIVKPKSKLTGEDTTWIIIPKWNNSGDTQTRFLSSRLKCVAIDKKTGKLVTAGELSDPTTRDIGPKSSSGTGNCVSTYLQIGSNQSIGLLSGIYSIVTYYDIFGDIHRSEQCYTVEFTGDPSIANEEAQRFIGTCDFRNCEDEECKI
jgi:hypothetical protein